jgi:hypothetical protein
LVFHFPHYGRGPRQTPQSAILVGRLKLIRNWETSRQQLFELGEDIGEQRDLASQMPDKAAALAKQLDAYLSDIEAQLPTINANYDSRAPQQRPPRLRGRAPGRPRWRR